MNTTPSLTCAPSSWTRAPAGRVEFRDGISSAARRNFQLFKEGQISREVYEDNKAALDALRRNGTPLIGHEAASAALQGGD